MTRRSRTDRAFARYRAHGDPHELAFVFDRTAAELLRVALHLTRDRALAEDLLQATGRVVDQDGAPVAHAVIESDCGNPVFRAVAEADAAGRFTLRDLVAHYELRARAPGFQPALISALRSAPSPRRRS
jgi:hypothetical protein